MGDDWHNLIDLFSDFGADNPVSRIDGMGSEEIERRGDMARELMLNLYNPNYSIQGKRGEFEKYTDAYKIMTAKQVLLSEERFYDFLVQISAKRLHDLVEMQDRARGNSSDGIPYAKFPEKKSSDDFWLDL
ncbi:MAG: hypothetical protein OEL87_03445 [Nanoarchaeota archaeon]|nr:hypothetical protein [Nanoarchaeota archaeon]